MEIKNVRVTQRELREIVELERDIAPKVKRIEELKSNVKALLTHKMGIHRRLNLKQPKNRSHHNPNRRKQSSPPGRYPQSKKPANK
jgi:hypothetical protein